MMWSSWMFGTALQGPGYGSGGVIELEQVKGVLLLYGALFLLGIVINILLLIRFSRAPRVWDRKMNRLLWRPWGLDDVWLMALMILLLHLLAIGALRTIHSAGWLDVLDERNLWIVAHSVVLHWAAIALIGWRSRRRAISWRIGFAHAGAAIGGDVLKGVAAYAATIPFLLFYAALYHGWLQWTGREPEPQDVVKIFAEMEAGFIYYYFIGLALVIAPWAEELIFRGVLLPALGRKMGVGGAVVLSSVLFAVIHFHVPSLIPLFVFSVALSLAYIYTESIIVPIVMHALFNAVSLMVMVMIG